LKAHRRTYNPKTVTEHPKDINKSNKIDYCKLVAAIDNLDSALALIDRDMRVLWHSEGICKKKGRSVVGEKCHEAVFESSRVCNNCLVQRTFETGEPQEGNLSVNVPGIGHLMLRVATSPIKDENGQVVQVLQLIHNLTTVPTAEFELKKYKQLIDMSDDYMSTLDESCRLLVINRKMINDLGRSEDELIGRPWLDLVAETDRPKSQLITEKARKFGIAADNIHLVRKDNTTIPTYASISFDAEQGIYEIVCRDISQQLQMAEELRKRTEELEVQNQKVLKAIQDKDRFCRIMSHELRTPLTSIIGFATMLLDDPDEPLTDRQRASVERIASNSKKLLDLVNGLLDLSRLDAAKIEIEPSRIAVGKFLEQVVDSLKPLAKGKDLKLSVDVPDDIPEIVTDQRMLNQIVVNLVSNAIKFTPQGNVRVIARKNGSDILIAVEDTGIGIPPEDLPFVFEEFYRSSRPGHKTTGTGLGLAISKRLAELLGGEITVQSKENFGSTFTLVLPIVRS